MATFSLRRTPRPSWRLPHRLAAGAAAAITIVGLGASFTAGADAYPNGQPRLVASIDRAVSAGAKITMTGWAVDQDRPSTSVVIKVLDSTGAMHSVTADGARPDVDRVLGVTGNHGYSLTFAEPNPANGYHRYCLAIKVAGQPSTPITCSGPLYVTHNPIGHLDVASRLAGQSIALKGWAADDDAPATATTVRVYVDATYAGAGLANLPRPDVNRVFNLPGNHGFAITLTGVQGTHNYCAYGINVGAGANSLLGCITVTVNHNPIGYQDQLLLSGNPTVVHGWAFDPDSPATSIFVDIYVDGTTFVAHVPTTVARPDVNRAYGITGIHGFSYNARTLPGEHLYCAYGINVGAGRNAELALCWNAIN